MCKCSFGVDAFIPQLKQRVSGLFYHENETWTDGDWRLLISSEYVNSQGLRNGYSCIQKIFEITKETILDLQDIELVEFDGGDLYKHFILERIDIK